MKSKGILGRSAVAAGLAMGIALAATATANASASAVAADSIAAHQSGKFGPFGYGGVKLGMTAKQAKATKKIVRKDIPASTCSGWDLKAHPTGSDAVGLYISKKLGVALISAPKGVKTPQGIGIGSTKKQLEKAYAKVETAESGYLVAAVPGNAKASYNFQLSKGKVYEMGLVLKNQDCTN